MEKLHVKSMLRQYPLNLCIPLHERRKERAFALKKKKNYEKALAKGSEEEQPAVQRSETKSPCRQRQEFLGQPAVADVVLAIDLLGNQCKLKQIFVI